LGDRFAVNGIIQPKVSVLRRKYRFRLLNAGPSRFYQFFLMKVTNDAPPKYEEHEFMHIGNDESLFVAALPTNSIILSVAERGDVVIDFTHFARGDRVFLVNRLKMQDTGMGPEFNSETNQMVLVPADQGDKILCFEVGEDAPDPSRVPGQLRCQPLLPSYLPKPLTANALKALDNHKLYEFVRDPLDFVWKINGKEFDGNAMRELIQQGPPEGKGYDGVVWTLKNQAGEVWSHPIHIHLEEFRILLRNGVEPPLNERCKKDVLFLAPKEEVQIFVRFRDFLGKYPMHCHNVVHEDMMMMLRYDIVGFNPQ
jgi:FtsP/CotA-like multicopper oxidase with cupredoxin domain